MEGVVNARFDEIHNLIEKSLTYASKLTDKDLYGSLDIMDEQVRKKRDNIIKALREYDAEKRG